MACNSQSRFVFAIVVQPRAGWSWAVSSTGNFYVPTKVKIYFSFQIQHCVWDNRSKNDREKFAKSRSFYTKNHTKSTFPHRDSVIREAFDWKSLSQNWRRDGSWKRINWLMLEVVSLVVGCRNGGRPSERFGLMCSLTKRLEVIPEMHRGNLY